MEGLNTSKGPGSGGGFASRVRQIDGRTSAPVKQAVRNTFPKKGGSVSKQDVINPDNKNSRDTVHFEEYTAPLKSDSGQQSYANADEKTSADDPPPIVEPVPQEDNSKKEGDSLSDVPKFNGSVKATGSYASALNKDNVQKKVNFRFIEAKSSVDGIDLVLPLESVREVNSRFLNSLYGYFLGTRLAYPVVEAYVKNAWAKFGLKRVMMNSVGFFFFQFESADGMKQVLARGPWMIRSVPLFLNEWTPNTCLTKQELKKVPVWVKFYDVPLAAYTEDGLSMLASKLGRPLLLDSYTSQLCLSSWGRHSYARALIELNAEIEWKDELVIGIPNLDGVGFSKEVIGVECEWEPPHCQRCKIFGHNDHGCPFQVKASKEIQNKDPQVGDGFIQVNRRKGKGKDSADTKIGGVKLTKPKPAWVPQKKQTSHQETKGRSDDPKTRDPKPRNTNAAAPSTSNVKTSNSFAGLEDESGNLNASGYVIDSDEEEVLFDESEHAGAKPLGTTGASTPASSVPHV